MHPDQTVGAELARDGGLIGGEIVAGVHIHSCGHGFYGFRPYGESLGKAPSNQTLLPLSSGASLRLGIPSLRSCSVGPPRSAIHGRARLTRHPCRVAHCAEPALGLTRGQEDQKPKQSKATTRFFQFDTSRHRKQLTFLAPSKTLHTATGIALVGFFTSHLHSSHNLRKLSLCYRLCPTSSHYRLAYLEQ